MFADWGADFLKYDLCSYHKFIVALSPDEARAAEIAAYEKMHEALIKAGRPMLYSLCQYGFDYVWEWGPKVGATMWRTTGDVKDTYESITNIGFAQAGLSNYVGPGHWIDPDMLEIGNGGMNAEEYRTQMSLWAMLSAPLLAGNDLTQMSDETKSILLNKEVIAVDQDPLGKAGDRVWSIGSLEFWAKPLQDGAVTVAFFNRLEAINKMSFNLSDLGWRGPAKVRDLWKHEDLGTITGNFAVNVPRHGVVMLVLRK
jgi:alpha-galactosidase